MDPPSNIRSGGLQFAERQMLRHGWTEGKGLGKREDGISEAIKVKVKCDTAGVGHNSAEQFTFHWWDHVFNKTASSISVEPDQDGVTVKKLSEDGGAVSSKKPRKAMLRSNMLYGRFIKSATLMSGGEKPMEEPSSSDSSDSSEDEDSKLDLSSATKLSDEDLMKICGGRTAHKGARHGLTMSAKLSRIEEQERAFMEKYGKKETKLQPSKSEVRSTEEGNRGDNIRSKKKKLREGNVNGEEQNNPSDAEATKKKKYEKLSGDVPAGHEQHHVPSVEEDTRTSKKKKRRSKVSDNIDTEVLGNNKNDCSVEEENNRPKKKKTKETFKGHTEDCVQSTEDGDSGHDKDEDYENTEEAGKSKKKKRKTEEMFSGQWTENGVSRHEPEDKESEHTDEAGKSKKKKKKKKNKRTEDHEELVEAEEHTTCSAEKPSRKSKNKKVEEHDPCTEEEEDRSRRKKRTLVDNEDEPEEEEDAKATKKKNKSKRKDRKD